MSNIGGDWSSSFCDRNRRGNINAPLWLQLYEISHITYPRNIYSKILKRSAKDMSSLSLRMSALFCCRPSDYINTFSPRNCLRHLEAVCFKDLCRNLRHMLKDYLIRLLPYYTRTSLKDIIEVHCKQILCNIMKMALLGKI